MNHRPHCFLAPSLKGLKLKFPIEGIEGANTDFLTLLRNPLRPFFDQAELERSIGSNLLPAT